MIWDNDKLRDFKNYFSLTNKELASALGVSDHIAWKLVNDHTSVKPYATRLTAYLESVRAGKIREMEVRIDYYKAF